MGAFVAKVEPPGGDPLARIYPGYYGDLSAGQEVVRLDLKDQQDRASLDEWLEGTDLFLTASRPAALGRLGLSWPELHARFPRLCQDAIVGHPPPDEDAPGHDLTYQACFGTLAPPALPPVLVALSETARPFAEPLRRGLAAAGGILGGFPGHGLYRAQEGYLALAGLSSRTSGSGRCRSSG